MDSSFVSDSEVRWRIRLGRKKTWLEYCGAKFDMKQHTSAKL
jgi:hypothetical protein